MPIARNPMLKDHIKNLQNKFPESWSTNISGTIKKFPLPEKVTNAYIESSCFRKLIRPITLPGKIVLTYEAIKFMNRNDPLSNMNLAYDGRSLCL